MSVAQPKANVKKLHLVREPQPRLHLGAALPPTELNPGDYVAKCTGAWVEGHPIFRIVWQFELDAGRYGGVGLRKWFAVKDPTGEVRPESEYAKVCEIALQRPLEPSDDLHDPAGIFVGKVFTVRVGYRKTETQTGGSASNENAKRKKDASDKLRVHEILNRVL